MQGNKVGDTGDYYTTTFAPWDQQFQYLAKYEGCGHPGQQTDDYAITFTPLDWGDRVNATEVCATLSGELVWSAPSAIQSQGGGVCNGPATVGTFVKMGQTLRGLDDCPSSS
jgi:hypothetical protein